MANEERKLKRAQARQSEPATNKARRSALSKPLRLAPGESLADPVAGQLKGLVLRLGLPVLGVWLLFGMLAAWVTSQTWRIVLVSVPLLLTLVAVAALIWVRRQAGKARGVAAILREVQASGDREAALEKLDTAFGKADPAKVFAKAQLELEGDPRRALSTLEQINLGKVLAPVADEARSQRAMIHLMLGEVSAARQLVDNIELKRHQDPKSRAMIAAVVSEALARSGAAKKAGETLDLFEPEDEIYEQLRPQLYRARAFACAYQSDAKGMRRAMKKLLEQDARLLGGFLVKKTHPLLQKEAKRMLEQSGQVPRKMVVQSRQ
jgi:hypothetical protein